MTDNQQDDTDKTENDMQAMMRMSEEIKDIAVGLSLASCRRPTIMLGALAVALVELNYDYSRGNDGEKGETLDAMLDVLREMHAHYAEGQRLQAIREAADAREKGRIQ